MAGDILLSVSISSDRVENAQVKEKKTKKEYLCSDLFGIISQDEHLK